MLKRPKTAATLLIATVLVPQANRPACAQQTLTVCSSGCDFSSIQDAVDDAIPGDTIELGPETFYENVTVGKTLTILGAGTQLTAVDGNAGAHGFLHTAGILTLSDMTVRNAAVGIQSHGQEMTVENCELHGSPTGVGVTSWGWVVPEVFIRTTTITGTQAPGSQACVHNEGANLTLERSTISGCSTGVYTTGGWAGDESEDFGQPGSTRISNSTVSATLRAVTVECDVPAGSCSDCPSCFGICFSGSASIENSTIAGSGEYGLSVSYQCRLNHGGGSGGGGSSGIGGTPPPPCPGCFATLSVEGSLVDGSGFSDCDLYGAWPTLTDQGHNISTDETCPWGNVGDPLLLPLADNGGPTFTHALSTGSPAIDAGGLSCDPADQRGVARPQDGNGDGAAECDIGAFEYAVPVDADHDGVLDELDLCPETAIPESVPTHHLGVNRWALVDHDTAFDTTTPPGGGGGPDFEFTVMATQGCSCEQIVEALDLGWGHTKFGCSTGAMLQWTAAVGGN